MKSVRRSVQKRAKRMGGPHILIILDGLGLNRKKKYNAVFQAHPLHLNSWFRDYCTAQLAASQAAVGLPEKMIGNSEVGHLTIGAGRIIEQSVTFFLHAVQNGTFFVIPILRMRLKRLKKTGGRLHVMGLLSDAGVHSHEAVIFAIIKLAHEYEVPVVVHPFLDGRDTPPESAKLFLQKLQNVIDRYGGVISSLHGRFYAMDRDGNTDRTDLSVRVLTQRRPGTHTRWHDVVRENYSRGITDEFIPPTPLAHHQPITAEDGVIFTNWRADRARQLTAALWQHPVIPKAKPAWFIAATEYEKDFDTDVLLKKKDIKNTLLDVIQAARLRIFTIAETEKYAAVTYFFNGGRECKRSDETRIMVPSCDVPSYALTPHMSAHKITELICLSLEYDKHDFYLVNYANADMVGHSGDLAATIQAITCLDTQLGILYEEAVKKHNATLYITSDHGNAEDMYSVSAGQPLTAHTLNPVPFLKICKNLPSIPCAFSLSGISEIARYILTQMDLTTPREMG